MADLTAKRTLVKSPPELWTEVSEVESLARHLGEFGAIRITKVEPETAVAWEGEHGSGTVELEASGWGTKVTLTAAVTERPPAPEMAPEDEPLDEPARAPAQRPPTASKPVAVASPSPPRPTVAPPTRSAPTPARVERQSPRIDRRPQPRPERRGLLGRLFGRRQPASPARPSYFTQPAAPVQGVRREPERRREAIPPAPVAAPPPPVAPEPPPVTNKPPPVAQERPAEEKPQAAEKAPSATCERHALDADAAQAVLESTLDHLGSAHHRPFSRE